MAEEVNVRNFKELIKKVGDLSKITAVQNKQSQDNDKKMLAAQNKTTDMVTRRLTKAQKEQLAKDNEQIKIAKAEAAAQEKATKAAQKSTNLEIQEKRVEKRTRESPSARKRLGKIIPTGVSYLKKLSKGVTGFTGKQIRAGTQTIFSVIKKLYQGGILLLALIGVNKLLTDENWNKVIDVSKSVIVGVKGIYDWIKEHLPNVLFGKGGTFAEPTGGLYGNLKNIVVAIGGWVDETGVLTKIKNFVVDQGKEGSTFRKTLDTVWKAIDGTYKFFMGDKEEGKKGFFENVAEFVTGTTWPALTDMFGKNTENFKSFFTNVKDAVNAFKEGDSPEVRKKFFDALKNVFGKDGILDTTGTGLAKAFGAEFGEEGGLYGFLAKLTKQFFKLAVDTLKDVMRAEMPFIGNLLFGTKLGELEDTQERIRSAIEVARSVGDEEEVKRLEAKLQKSQTDIAQEKHRVDLEELLNHRFRNATSGHQEATFNRAKKSFFARWGYDPTLGTSQLEQMTERAKKKGIGFYRGGLIPQGRMSSVAELGPELIMKPSMIIPKSDVQVYSANRTEQMLDQALNRMMYGGGNSGGGNTLISAPVSNIAQHKTAVSSPLVIGDIDPILSRVTSYAI